MPLSVRQISDNIVRHMQTDSRDVVTMRWSKFYEFCERDRIKESFIEALKEQLRTESVLFVSRSLRERLRFRTNALSNIAHETPASLRSCHGFE
jgi:hypothetical protein